MTTITEQEQEMLIKKCLEYISKNHNDLNREEQKKIAKAFMKGYELAILFNPN